jgi:hypothetical protein
MISIISGLIFFVKGTVYDKLPFSFSANIQTYLSIFFLSFAIWTARANRDNGGYIYG